MPDNLQRLDTQPVHVGTTVRGMTTALGSTAREFVSTRNFSAPRELVFAAWTQPKQLAHWWGPHSMTNPVCEVDLRPGGRYRIVMRSPEEFDYPLDGEYREIVKPQRLVFTDGLERRLGAEPGIPARPMCHRAPTLGWSPP